ncbi:MAG TPA: Asp-tRNA(Asn)/Glu-tRNA(Gln) amidotransferase subunit GatB [Actinomycetota bacterium]|nr:Asp-tRNA(Asn)/Glu-tRNA(Gln) amidotransferase subunit GatB [Actinomycetota bacterium]
MTYEPVIGLECHVELATRTKMFCGCANSFGAAPNTQVCEVCLGHPGTLPVANGRAVEFTMKIGLALGCEIAPRSLFHRKNYFYPDMPKNYQISQFDLPLCTGGALEIEVGGETRRIGVHRVHLEEDTGKTLHMGGASGRIADANYALEDYNRAGVPLVEVVSEPDMRSADEARAYFQELRLILESLGVSDVRMEEGSLRCDANVSVRPQGATDLGTKVEIKNLNSVRSLERAIRFEAERQRAALERGEELVQETRHWDEGAGLTLPLRSKEYAFDYRYFPEPDLQPIEPGADWIDRLRSELPELPAARRARLSDRFQLSPEQLVVIGSSSETARLFEEAFNRLEGVGPRTIANWIVNVGPDLVRDELDALVDVIRLTELGEISVLAGKEVLAEALATGQDPKDIVEAKGLRQISDEGALTAVIDRVIAENPGPVEQFRAGKEGVLGFLVGQVMKATNGSANPKEAGRLLRERLMPQG